MMPTPPGLFTPKSACYWVVAVALNLYEIIVCVMFGDKMAETLHSGDSGEEGGSKVKLQS